MPLTGDINVTIYSGNRQLWAGGKVRLIVLDPFSNTEKILVDHFTRKGTATVLLKDVPADRGQNYSILASAKGHRDAGIYPVKARPSGVVHTAVMLIRNDPELDHGSFSYAYLKERSPEFYAAISQTIDEQTFLGLEPEQIAGALNIEAKLRETKLTSIPAVSFVKKIERSEDIRQDRLYVEVAPDMPDQVRQEIRERGTFTELAEWANELWHEGYPVSFKQRVPFGSLQLSFAEKPVNGLLRADIDIDLFTDIGHLGEVLRNKLTTQKTDPYTVYVQLFDQRIFPSYLLKA